MNYLYAALGLVAAIHAFTYGRWLMKNGNRFGGYVVYFLVLLSVAMPVLRLIKSP